MLLQIDDISKTYRGLGRRSGVRANDGISLAVDEGEVYGLLGHNGAGKTTLVSQIVGLLRPDGGSILIDGRDVILDPGFARRAVSLQPQAQLPINGLSPRRAIDLVGQMRGGAHRDVQRRRTELVDRLDLGEWLDTDGERLSGGVKRLVSFAMAAVCPGRLVMLDEPTNDVDPVRRRLLWLAVRALADEGRAVLLVTHNVVEAERAVDRLAVLDAGRLVAEGTPSQLKAGLEDELRLEIVLEPGRPAPTAPPFAARYQPKGARALAIVPAGRASDGLAWVQGLRDDGVVGEFALTPASLEDAYVGLVGDRPDEATRASATPTRQEANHARAA